MSKFRLHISRKNVVFIVALTAVVLLTLPVFIMSSIRNVDKLVMKYSFDELAETSEALAAQLRASAATDRTILTAIAEIIAKEEDPSDARLRGIINSYSIGQTYLSYLELLRPDGKMLDAGGGVRDVSDAFDFAKEAEEGYYISNVCQSSRDPDEKVIRAAVPVIKRGQVIYMLYGVIRLSELAEKYTTNIYGGHAYVMIVDGDTGDFLLDTWHKTLGNIKEMGGRKMLPGYSLEESTANLAAGISGNMAFYSKTTGGVLYLRYDPIGINNWNVMVHVERVYAMQKGDAISAVLYKMAAHICVLLLLYVTCVTVCLVRAYAQVQRLGTTDQTTGLFNRNAYDKFVADSQKKTFASIVCIYADVNGLHELNNKYGHAAGDQMLRTMAAMLAKSFGDERIYRVGGDEFVVLCENGAMDACAEKMREVTTGLEAHDYHMAYGMVYYENETGLDRAIRESDEKMLENKRAYYAGENSRRRS